MVTDHSYRVVLEEIILETQKRTFNAKSELDASKKRSTNYKVNKAVYDSLQALFEYASGRYRLLIPQIQKIGDPRSY